MKIEKIFFEIVGVILFVFGGTALVFYQISDAESFWNAQTLWSIALAAGWIIVAAGYFHQGWLVHRGHDGHDVSPILPIAVFVVQCILFVKGVYYQDWSLMLGAVLVNSGVTFSVYQLFKVRRLKF